MRLLRKEGFLVGVVERTLNVSGVPFTKFDLFGFADLIAIRKQPARCLLIQTTSKHNIRDREHKVAENFIAAIWLSFPHHAIEVHGWVKRRVGGRSYWYCERTLAYVDNDKVMFAKDVTAPAEDQLKFKEPKMKGGIK